MVFLARYLFHEHLINLSVKKV